MKSKKYVIYAKKSFVRIKMMKMNLNEKKSEIIVITLRNLRYKVPKKISVVFHNGSAYDYHL